MSFIAPVMLALLALSLPVFVAFLSRKKVDQKVVPSLVILKHVKSAEPRSRSFATPRNLFALLLYLLAIIALAIASAQPAFDGEEPRDVVIVVDASFSMGVKTGSELDDTYLDRARRRIEEEVLDGLGPRDRATLIVGDVSRQVQVEPTRDLSRHFDALKALATAGEGKHVGQSLQLADALCQGQEHGEIVFVTDGVAHGESLPTLSCAHSVMTLREDGDASPANIALTRLAVRQIDALGTTEVYTEVLNASANAREVVIELELDDLVVEVLAVNAPAGERVGQMTRIDGGLGARLVARVAHQDGQVDALAMDDVAYAMLNPIAWVDVLLVSDREFSFIERAFSLHPRVRLEVATAAEAAQKMQGRELVIFEEGTSQALVDVVPEQAKILLLGAQPVDGVTFKPEVERPVMSWWDFDDDLFRYVDLDDVEILTASPVTELQGDAVLMRAGQDQAMLVRRKLGDHTALVMAFHPDQSDLVLRVAFANMMANIVEWCAATIQQKPAYAVRLGEPLVGPQDVTRLNPVPEDAGEVVQAGQIMTEPGVWQIEGGPADGEFVVVNQRGGSESLLVATPEAFAAMPAWDRDAFAAGDRGAKLIRWLLLAAFALMVIEACVMWWKSRSAGRRAQGGPLSAKVAGLDEQRGEVRS